MTRSRTRLAALAATLFTPAIAGAQALAPKRVLPLPAAGCLRVTPSAAAAAARPDVAESRRAAAQARGAALAGDRAAARDAFQRAAALNRNDEQLAYDLGRAYEELDERENALREYCRYVGLAPNGRQVADVQGRIERLSPSSVLEAARRAAQSFEAGLAAYDRGLYAAAAASFDRVLRDVPTATEALYDRALARAALGQRPEAVRDLESYLATAQAAEDRAAVLRAVDVLRRPVYAPSTAFARGLAVPGLGQFYTGRPALGVVTVVAVAGAAAAALYEHTVVRQQTFVPPFGEPYTQGVPVRERPYTGPAVGAGAAIWLLMALEARHHAAGTQGITPVVTHNSAGLRIRTTF